MLTYRKCPDKDCSFSEKLTPCTLDQMREHVSKKPTEKLVEIVTKNSLARFPSVLSRVTLWNLIADYSSEDVIDEIMKGASD